MNRNARRRYALVGAGHRAQMYVDALLRSHAEHGELVALCDSNPVRMEYYRDTASAAGLTAPTPYDVSHFDEMLDNEDPDVVMVTSVDRTHAEYVVAALRNGRDVICEKPLTTDENGCRAIAKAAAASSGELVVTFNYRYSPRNSAVKQLIASGAVGEVTSVTFEWLLDTVHGADYFRRWHRQKHNSGGLLVHKAAHHFDLVNWWVADTPARVAALGTLSFYGAGKAGRRRRDEDVGDPFLLDLRVDPRLEALYGADARRVDGYVRDRDVFAEGVDIEDNIGVLVGYRSGALLTYSLNAHAPWEGYRVAINGTEGRLELEVCERAAVFRDSAGGVLGGGQALDPSVRPDVAQESPAARPPGAQLVLQRHWEEARRIDVAESDSAHGGGDALLLDDLFIGGQHDPLGRRADFRDGIRSVLVGAAANRAIAAGRLVDVAELGVPDWAYAVGPDAVAATSGPSR